MKEDTLDPVWKALADPTRRGILDLLNGQPRTTGDLAAAFPHLSRFAVMKHLASLEEAGLILVRRRGRERWNHLNAVPIREIYERWIGAYEDQWAGSLLRMRHFAEGQTGKDDSSMETATVPNTIRSFVIEQEIRINALAERVFKAFTEDVAQWWEFRLIGGDIRLEAEPGGRFIETNGDDAAVVWATVSKVQRNERLTMGGALGTDGAIVSVVDYTFEENENGSVVKLNHSAIGDFADDTESNYIQGWQHLHNRLKSYLETGDPGPSMFDEE